MGEPAMTESTLAAMESLQDEVLTRLDELNARIEMLLAAEAGASDATTSAS